MDTIRRLSASAGAEWLLGGFALLKKAPMALGTLGALWGLLGTMVVFLAAVVPPLAAALQLLLAIAGPVLFAGLLWAVREVQQDRPALPAHLSRGLQDGHAPALLATLLPQVVAGLLLGVLLLVLVGPDQLQRLSAVSTELNTMAAAGEQPTPEQVQAMVAELPAGRILLWLVAGLCVAMAAAATVFVAVPRILFDGRPGLAAMGDSLRAALANLPAVLVFFLLAVIALFAVYFMVMLVALLAQAVAGPLFGALVAQVLLMAVVMPLLAGSALVAWGQLFGGTSAAPVQSPGASGRLEA